MIFHFGTSQLMCQNKLLGVVGGVLGRHTLLIFQKLFTGKSVFLINQFTFWNFSHVNTIKCIFASWEQCFHLDSMLQAGHLLAQLVQVGFQEILHLPPKYSKAFEKLGNPQHSAAEGTWAPNKVRGFQPE